MTASKQMDANKTSGSSTPEQDKTRRQRNLKIALALGAFIAFMFALTIFSLTADMVRGGRTVESMGSRHLGLGTTPGSGKPVEQPQPAKKQ